MADFPTITNPEKTDDFDFSDLLAGQDQWINMVGGINLFADGVEQSVAEMSEMLGLSPVGSARFKTEELKREQEMIAQQGDAAGRRSGAAGFRFAGEAAPLLLPIVGSGVKSAAAIGGLMSSGFFQDNVDDSRLPAIATGAIAGGLIGTLIRGGAAKVSADDAVNRLMLPNSRSGQKLLTDQRPAPMGGARSAAPNGQQPALPAPARGGLQASDFYPAGSGNRMPAVPNQLALPSPRAMASQAAGRLRSVLAKGGPQAGALAERAIKKVVEFARKAESKAERLAAAVGRSKGAQRIAAQEALDIAQSQAAAGGVLVRSLQAGLKRNGAQPAHLPKRAEATGMYHGGLPEPVQAPTPQLALPAPAPKLGSSKPVGEMTVKELKAELTKQNENITGISKLKKDDLVKMVEESAPTPQSSLGLNGRPSSPGGKQAGFTNTDLQSRITGTALGATGGAVLGGATGDGDAAIPAAIAGGLLGMAAGARLAKSLGRAGEHSRKAKLRRVDSNAGALNEKITNNMAIKNFTGEKISEFLSAARNIVDEFAGSTMTRLQQIAPRLAVALAETEYLTHANAQKYIARGDAVFKRIDALELTDTQAKAFKIAALNSRESAKRVLRGFGKDASVMDDFGGIMDEMGVYLGTAELGGGLRANYVPRQVVDTSYFENIPEYKTYLGELAKKKGVSELTGFEKEIALSEVINGAMQRGESKTAWGRAASQLQKRGVKVDGSNVDAYADVREGFHDYVQNITTQVERRKFFKGQGADVSDLGPNAENIDQVTGRLAKQLAKGDLTEEKVDEATRLIRMRFGPGEQAPSRAVQNFKNLTYMGLLSHPASAATQFGDTALSMYRNGIGNTVGAMIGQISGRGKLNGLDKETLLGIRNAATDFASKVGTRDALAFGLKYSGFSHMDTFGKNTFMQAAMSKAKKMPEAEFKQKWSKIFDPEAEAGMPTPRTDSLFAKVQEFDKIIPENREDIGFMLWNELSDVQPIALSSMPERYLQHPNGRMAYMLQSFTLKLFDVMRKDIYNAAANGQYKKAVVNATKLSTLFVATNGTVDGFKGFMMGKDQTVPDVVVNNYLKMLGMNKYMLDGIGSDGLGDTLLKTIGPPMALPNALLSPEKALKMAPIGGRAVEGLFNR